MRSRFSVLVARRVYRKIGDYILKQKNTENYNKAGKIYVPIFGKIVRPDNRKKVIYILISIALIQEIVNYVSRYNFDGFNLAEDLP